MVGGGRRLHGTCNFVFFERYHKRPSMPWQRFLAPWNATPRYTFTMVEPIADRIVVAPRRTFRSTIQFEEETRWSPELASATMRFHDPVESKLENNQYILAMPALTENTNVDVSIGDNAKTITIEPKLRPELSTLTAKVTLPNIFN